MKTIAHIFHSSLSPEERKEYSAIPALLYMLLMVTLIMLLAFIKN